MIWNILVELNRVPPDGTHLCRIPAVREMRCIKLLLPK